MLGPIISVNFFFLVWYLGTPAPRACIKSYILQYTTSTVTSATPTSSSTTSAMTHSIRGSKMLRQCKYQGVVGEVRFHLQNIILHCTYYIAGPVPTDRCMYVFIIFILLIYFYFIYSAYSYSHILLFYIYCFSIRVLHLHISCPLMQSRTCVHVLGVALPSLHTGIHLHTYILRVSTCIRHV